MTPDPLSDKELAMRIRQIYATTRFGSEGNVEAVEKHIAALQSTIAHLQSQRGTVAMDAPPMVASSVYESAVHGRAEFRKAYRALRKAIRNARAHLEKGRALWNGPCHQCAAVLDDALYKIEPKCPFPRCANTAADAEAFCFAADCPFKGAAMKDLAEWLYEAELDPPVFGLTRDQAAQLASKLLAALPGLTGGWRDAVLEEAAYVAWNNEPDGVIAAMIRALKSAPPPTEE